MHLGKKPKLPRLSLKETAAALLSGGLAGLSQPLVVDSGGEPLFAASSGAGLLALVALVPALVVARDASAKRAFWIGAATFWMYLVVVGHWLVVPFATFGGAPAAVAVLAMLVITGALAVFLALPFAVMGSAARRFGWPAWVTFPAALSAVELLRNSVPFGGVPWANLGSSLATVDVLRQGASLFGVYGLVFVVGLTNAVLADLWLARGARRRLPLAGLTVGGAVLVSLIVYGFVRLAAPAGEGRVTVGLLQPSIPQDVINAADNDDAIRAEYHELQSEALALGAEVIVWPEAALVPSVPADSASLREAGVVDEKSRKHGLVPKAAIVGALSWRRALNESTGRLEDVRHTSAFVTGEDLVVKGRYDKVRLMPFGEYVPWPFSLVLDKLVTADGALSAGAAPRAVPLELLNDEKVGITVCWDGLFPDVTRALVQDGAVQLYNLTNDAWYGATSEPWQHLAAYALRATESGRPLVRAANSGVSGWFDARGRFYNGTRPFVRTAVIARVPTSDEVTLYMRFGDWVAFPSLVFTTLLSLLLLVGVAFGRR